MIQTVVALKSTSCFSMKTKVSVVESSVIELSPVLGIAADD
jgi:hypothetical protein